LYLAVFAGIIIYLATSHILPEAHARHSSRWTLVATIAGVLVMWGLVSQLHAVHLHSHDGHSVESEHEDHDHEDGTKEEDDHDHDHNE
ncbi:MAG: divalent heavy-metal cations transporter, partial [Actinomycetota bacterium]